MAQLSHLATPEHSAIDHAVHVAIEELQNFRMEVFRRQSLLFNLLFHTFTPRNKPPKACLAGARQGEGGRDYHAYRF